MKTIDPTQVLGKVIDDLRNHEKKHKGNSAKEVQFNPIGFEKLERCNFFRQNVYALMQLNEKGNFTLLGVKCTINEQNEAEYLIIDNIRKNGVNL